MSNINRPPVFGRQAKLQSKPKIMGNPNAIKNIEQGRPIYSGSNDEYENKKINEIVTVKEKTNCDFNQYYFAGSIYLSYNENRVYLIIQNQDTANNLYITFVGGGAISRGIRIAPGGYYEPFISPKNSVNAYFDGGGNGFIVEGIIL